VSCYPPSLKTSSLPLMPSKNFHAAHQLDMPFWTEFLCMVYRQ